MRPTARRTFVALLLAILFVAPAAAAPPGPIHVLIINDDGVGAPGIDALVQRLAANPNLTLTVVAPAVNQSGSGAQYTPASGTITAASSMTASGFPAVAVNGFPADSVLLALRELLTSAPDLVVSGINEGQNIGDLIELSGTVGAALWAARLNVPAFAVSQGLFPPLMAPTTYAEAAEYTANLVEKFRVKKGFRKKMRETHVLPRALVLNVNFPTCPVGSTQGVRVVPPEVSNLVTGYNLISSMSGVDTWKPVTTGSNPFGTDCTIPGIEPSSDVEALNLGYASVTPLSATRGATSWKPKQFKFLQKLRFTP